MSSRIALWLCSTLGIMCPEVPLPSLDQMVQDSEKVSDISSEIHELIYKTTPEYNEFLERIDQMRIPQYYYERLPNSGKLTLDQKIWVLGIEGPGGSGSLAGDWHDFLSKQQVVIGNLFRKYFPTEDGSARSIREKIRGIHQNLYNLYKERLAKDNSENAWSLEDLTDMEVRVLRQCIILEAIVDSWYGVNWLRNDGLSLSIL